MNALKRKISKMKALNDDAIRKLHIAKILYKNNDISLSEAVAEAPIDLGIFSELENIYGRAIEISDILNKYDDGKIKRLIEQKKAGFQSNEFIEDFKDIDCKITECLSDMSKELSKIKHIVISI